MYNKPSFHPLSKPTNCYIILTFRGFSKITSDINLKFDEGVPPEALAFGRARGSGPSGLSDLHFVRSCRLQRHPSIPLTLPRSARVHHAFQKFLKAPLSSALSMIQN